MPLWRRLIHASDIREATRLTKKGSQRTESYYIGYDLRYTETTRQANQKDTMVFQPPKKLTKAQVELLALFDRDVSEEDWLEIRRLIARYFANKATQAADEVAEKRGWAEEDFERMLNGHYRTSS